MNIIIAGGTGLIGSTLLQRLVDENHRVVLLTRNPSRSSTFASPNVTVEGWDGTSIGSWVSQIDGADVVINLAGESIGGKRWSPIQKNVLVSSRVQATRAIIEAIHQAKRKPSLLMNASAVGYYGDVPDGEVTEESLNGSDFLATLCATWESEAALAVAHGVRTIILRTGLVLSTEGGALQKMLLAFKIFIGGPFGSGRQWMSWIHIDDHVNSILYAISNQSLSGPINLTAPQPVRTKDFCRELGKAMHRPSWAPIPACVLKIALGEMSDMLLTGQRVVPKKLTEHGYTFLYPSLEQAFANLFKKK